MTRPILICLKTKLNLETDFINVLLDNGYILNIEQFSIHVEIAQLNMPEFVCKNGLVI